MTPRQRADAERPVGIPLDAWRGTTRYAMIEFTYAVEELVSVVVDATRSEALLLVVVWLLVGVVVFVADWGRWPL